MQGIPLNQFGYGEEIGLVIFLTVVCSLVLLSWYLSISHYVKEANKKILGSQEIYYRNLSRGSVETGIYVILSMIPYIGFIFMFLSSSSISRMRRVTAAINHNFSKASRRYVMVSFLTGLGMFISTLVSLAGIGFLHNSTSYAQIFYLEILWYPIYFTVSVGTLLSVSTPGIRGATGVVGTLSILAYMGVILSSGSTIFNYNIIYFIEFTEILIALLFMVNYHTTKVLHMKIVKNNTGIAETNVTNTMSMAGDPVINEGYKPEFNRDKNQSANQKQQVNSSQNQTNYQQRNAVSTINTKYEQKDAIAIIGPPAAGKTTFLAYFFHFLQDIEAAINVEADVVSGIDLMEEYINRIFSEHKFPELTAKDRVGEVVFQFTKKKRFGSNRIYLRINDIAGETFNSLQGGPDNVRRMLMNTRFEYLLKAKGYLVMIDCSSYREWATRDLQYRRIIETILNARVDKKSRPNIAFLFTKTDTLPDAVFNYSAIDLLKLLRNTYAYITKNIKNPSAFKIFIKTERDQNGEIVPKLDLGVGGMYGINFDPQLNSGFILIANWISEVGDL
jgi:GTPase SAR1 family protein